MSETPDLPKTLERHCCRGKSCTTTLYLDSVEVGTAPGEPSLPPLYRYRRRSNDDVFGPDWSTAASLAAWVEQSAAEDAEEAERQRASNEEYAAYLAEQDKL
ncbi:hypothetical protein [Arthrobacter sp. zg-Y1110]|uniref:hypothetical protein n=1 Tax=Arthrobacter sp. zg-Y1110 TaxID=2886932 RepID=UPI001D1378AE|nr:hypothetical protein [Arthrobacter sp. zg-Y1110]MCC3292358.1 hypothetical protein [Arthrobacter sp. zg-Y1110]UWX86739.1 hypothetical protein N2K99_18015 [Arthrobacter sp. zg-Y1110]